MELLNNLKASFIAMQEISWLGNLFSSIVLVVAILVIRWLGARAIRSNDALAVDVRRRWLVNVRNAALLLLLLGLVVIWAEQMRVVAVSIVAFAVAAVIATKELILCLSGSLLKSGGRVFKIGDRIEIGDLRGDVIDHNALTTTILEIGPGELTHQLTGRAIVLPNAIFLSTPVINESYTQEFVLHVFKVPVKIDENWQLAEQDLLAAAQQECSAFADEARKHFDELGKNEGLFSLSVEPRVSVAVPKADELDLIVRMAVPARRKGRIEQAILRRYLTAVAEREAAKDKSTPLDKSTTTIEEQIE